MNQIKALLPKWQVVEICLNDPNSISAGIRRRNLDCIADVNCPDLCTILSSIVCVATITTTCIQNSFASKRLLFMWSHVVAEVTFPLRIHFRKMRPFETKARSSLQLQDLIAVGTALRGTGHIRKFWQDTRNTIHDREGFRASDANKGILRTAGWGQGATARGTHQVPPMIDQ